jgi:hypothetical protein
MAGQGGNSLCQFYVNTANDMDGKKKVNVAISGDRVARPALP